MLKFSRRLLSLIIVSLLLISGIPASVSADTATVPAAPGTQLFPACVSQPDGDKWGYIDSTGKFVIQPVYVYVSDFNDKGIAIAMKGKSVYETCDTFFIDSTGKTVSGPYATSWQASFVNGYSVINTGKGSVVVGADGKVVLQSPYYLYSFHDGMIRFSSTAGGKTLYGYMDLSGKVIIPAKYQYAYDFVSGRAEVTISDSMHALIDKTGKVIETSGSYFTSGEESEGLITYSVSTGDYSYLYGYEDMYGNVVIPAMYTVARKFTDGYAVIATTPEGEYDDKYGVVDKTGNYVIEPEYSGITYLGEGLFAVSNNFYSFNADEFSPKAIFNSKGEKLTDYVYYTVNPFNNHLASVTDEFSTFFIGTDGKPAPNLPKAEGIGTLTIIGDIIKAEADNGLKYLKTDGTIIWAKAETIPLGSGISINTKKLRTDFCTFVEYPEVAGLTDKKVQDGINAKLKSYFTDGLQSGKTKDENGQDIYTETLDLRFSAQLNKNLLIIEESGYYYPIGAAHGMPSQGYYYIDLKTGSFYGLPDLFKKGSKFLDRLTMLVDRQIAYNMRTNAIMDNFYYFDEKPQVTLSHGFIINKDCLTVFFAPYEIQAYASGFPTFDIPYGQLSDLIDTKGAFWNSFDKTVANSKINIIGESIEDSVLTSIKNTMRSYETNLIDAINQNSFSKVEACLLKGSTLYNSQKQLVASLYKKGTKEKLISYDIYAVEYDYGKNEYKIFTNETVAVKSYGKVYINKQYSWCYTAVYDSNAKTVRLSKIEQW